MPPGIHPGLAKLQQPSLRRWKKGPNSESNHVNENPHVATMLKFIHPFRSIKNAQSLLKKIRQVFRRFSAGFSPGFSPADWDLKYAVMGTLSCYPPFALVMCPPALNLTSIAHPPSPSITPLLLQPFPHHPYPHLPLHPLPLHPSTFHLPGWSARLECQTLMCMVVFLEWCNTFQP